MTQRTVPDLKELFKQASEIAQQVPKGMQEAAFNRAVDLLTGSTEPGQRTKNENTSEKKRTLKSRPAPIKDQPASRVNELITDMDSTQHPGVTSAAKVLDRSLMVLQIALNDHSVDGLSCSDIAKILTDKFRISTSVPAIGMALGKATNFVNRAPSGPGFLYRIMKPGEEYLNHLATNKENSTTIRPGGKPKGKGKIPTKRKVETNIKKSVRKVSKKNSSKEGSNPQGSSKSSIGPKQAIVDLISSNFFSTSRTVPEVQKHLKNKRGYSIDIEQLSLAMLRLVRDEVLERDENEQGQYVYSKSKG